MLVAEDGSWTATEPDGALVKVHPDGSWDRSNPATGNTAAVKADGSWVTNENGGRKISAVRPNGTYEVTIDGQGTHESPSAIPQVPVKPNNPNAVTPKAALQPSPR